VELSLSDPHLVSRWGLFIETFFLKPGLEKKRLHVPFIALVKLSGRNNLKTVGNSNHGRSLSASDN
jgi:hypothetical protein